MFRFKYIEKFINSIVVAIIYAFLHLLNCFSPLEVHLLLNQSDSHSKCTVKTCKHFAFFYWLTKEEWWTRTYAQCSLTACESEQEQKKKCLKLITTNGNFLSNWFWCSRRKHKTKTNRCALSSSSTTIATKAAAKKKNHRKLWRRQAEQKPPCYRRHTNGIEWESQLYNEWNERIRWWMSSEWNHRRKQVNNKRQAKSFLKLISHFLTKLNIYCRH